MNAATAKFFGCTEAQASAQMIKNLTSLQKMKDKAVKSGKKVNDYTADDLEGIITKVNKGWNL